MRFFYRRLFVDAWSTEAFEAQSMRLWAWLTGAGGVGLTLLASGLLFVQIRAREAQARVMEALHAANSELLLAYRERENLSRDLHDGSIQNFYALGLHLQRVQALFDGHPKQAQSELKKSVAMLDHSIEDLRQSAKKRLPRAVFDFFDGGAEDEVTLQDNAAAYKRLRLLPRSLTPAAPFEQTPA